MEKMPPLQPSDVVPLEIFLLRHDVNVIVTRLYKNISAENLDAVKGLLWSALVARIGS